MRNLGIQELKTNPSILKFYNPSMDNGGFVLPPLINFGLRIADCEFVGWIPACSRAGRPIGRIHLSKSPMEVGGFAPLNPPYRPQFPNSPIRNPKSEIPQSLQRKIKRSALLHRSFRPYTAAVAVNDALNGCKTNTCALKL